LTSLLPLPQAAPGPPKVLPMQLRSTMLIAPLLSASPPSNVGVVWT